MEEIWARHIDAVPHMNGRVLESNAGYYDHIPQFSWRVPVVYDHGEQRFYAGQPGMSHDNLMALYDKPSPWHLGMPRTSMTPGFVDLGSGGSPGLNWFLHTPAPHIPDESLFHNWVEERYGVRNPQADDDDLSPRDWDDI